MIKKLKILIPVLLMVAAVVAAVWYTQRHGIPVLQPRGPVAAKERGLMVFALLLAVIVVVPTFALTIIIAVRYREGTPTAKAKYRPEFDHSRLFEAIWWGIPIIIIGILSVVAWNSAHSLDPYKPLPSKQPPLEVQVVAMDWKWLFIYPDQNIASVNQVAIPVGRPVTFAVTSDSVMNSFWVPQLGGQIYAMPGMKTELNLQADKTGFYLGSPANIAGKGFSRMDFSVHAMSGSDFDRWVASVQRSAKVMDEVAYQQLAKPSSDVPVRLYGEVNPQLYTDIMLKYMAPVGNMEMR